MKVLLLLCLCVIVQAANLNLETDRLPIDGKLQELLEVKHFEFHSSRNIESGADLSADNSLIAERNLVVDTILGILDDLRDVIINGSENVPPLDPLEISRIGPMELSAPAVRLSANLYDLNVDGLKWFVVDDLSFNIIRLAFSSHFTLPRLTISGEYDGEARLALFIRHTAGGAFRIFVNRVELGFDMRLGTSLFGGNLFLRELDIAIDIHDTNVFFEGLIGDGWVNSIFNSIIQSISQDVIQTELDNINEVINTTLFDIIDDFLRNFTLEDIQSNTGVVGRII